MTVNLPDPEPLPTTFCPELTLRQAIAVHHSRVPGLIMGDGNPELTALFGGHDAAHCVFNLGTRVDDEGRVDLWTLLGTTMTLRRYMTYFQHPEVKAIFANETTWAHAPLFLQTLVDLPKIWWRSRHMSQTWDFDDWEAWLDRPLSEIREAHGIEVLDEAHWA